MAQKAGFGKKKRGMGRKRKVLTNSARAGVRRWEDEKTSS